jgi:hypothetical protein
MALPALAQPQTVVRAALVGMGLLAMAGVWKGAPHPLDLFAQPAPQIAAPALLAASPARPAAQPIAATAAVAAGQPSVLSLPAGRDGDGASLAIGVVGVGQ